MTAAPLWCNPSFLRDPLKDLEPSPELRCALSTGKNKKCFLFFGWGRGLMTMQRTGDRADTCNFSLVSSCGADEKQTACLCRTVFPASL